MFEFLGNNINTVILVVLLLAKVLEYIAPKTATKIDDNIVSAVKWALQHANGAFNIVEDLSAAGVIKNSKGEAFRKKLNEQYQLVYGQPLPEQAISAAENVAAGLASADHNIKRLVASVNPPLPLAQ